MISRRAAIGAAGAVVLTGLAYRAWDRGVFSAGQGEAYAPWADWEGRTADGIRRPLRSAILAANPHDTQPWLFVAENDTITVKADRARNLGTFDPFRREMHLGLGCAIENLVIAAGQFGFGSKILPTQGRLVPSPSVEPVIAAQIALSSGPVRQSRYFAMIPRRHTNRARYRDDDIAAEKLRMLADLASGLSARVVFFQRAGGRSELGSMIVQATEEIVADREMSADSARWFRTGRREIEEDRDGVVTDAAGLSPLMTVAAKLMPDQGAQSADQYWLGMTRDTQVASAPVLGIILVKDRLDMAQAIEAGRAWQRLHLAATAEGIAAQPMNQPVEMIDRNQMLGKNDVYGPALAKLAAAQNWEPTFTFRMGIAEREAPPSPRRPLSDVLRA
jgi:nitroreductase